MPDVPDVTGLPNSPLRARCIALAEGHAFQRIVLIVILLNAVILGVDTYIDHRALVILEKACLAFFVFELAVKFIARRSTREFLSDPWNIFDIIVVGSAFIPAVGPLAPILRVLRVLRVFRLARNVPELRLIVTVLVRSIVSMKYIGMLAALCFYVFGVAGVELFGETQPEFATLHETLFTLFRTLTGDNWSDLRYAAVEGLDAGDMGFWKASLYHVLWIAIVTFVLINLIVGAIINNYQEVQAAEKIRSATAREGATRGASPAASSTNAARDELDARIARTSRELADLLDRRRTMG